MVSSHHTEGLSDLIECLKKTGAQFELIDQNRQKEELVDAFETSFPLAQNATVEGQKLYKTCQTFEWTNWSEEIGAFECALNQMLAHQKHSDGMVHMVFDEQTLPIFEFNIKDLLNCVEAILSVERGWLFSLSERAVIERRFDYRTTFSTL